MASLQEFARSADDVFMPGGELDVLAYYGLIAPKLERFLHGRELATRAWVPQGKIRSVVKRATHAPPLYTRQLAGAVTPELMRARAQYAGPEAAGGAISPDQALVWYYFPTRRYVELHYATNREGEGREISRVSFEIDPGKGATAEDAIEAAGLLAQAAMADNQVLDLTLGKPFASWTGNSFNLTLFLKEMQPARFYREMVEYTGRGRTISDRLVDRVVKNASMPIAGGHTRVPGHVLIDPSPTPSGHLTRVPIGSLNMRDAAAIGGVSVPLTLEMLRREEVADLMSYSPARIIAELDLLAQRLP